MVRSFTTESIPRRDLLELLDLARRAPSAGNTQAVSFLALDQKERVEMFWNTSLPQDRRSDFPWSGLLRAPVIILVSVKVDEYINRYKEKDKLGKPDANPLHWRVPYWFVDAGCVVQNLLLMAHSRNLGALFFGIFKRDEAIKREFEIPEDVELVGAVALGNIDHETERPSKSLSRGRKNLEDVVHLNSW